MEYNKNTFIAHAVVVSASVCHRGDQDSNPGRAVKFGIANLSIKGILSGSNILFLCPLDVLTVLYYHQFVPCAVATQCHVAWLRVAFRVCLCVRVRVWVCVW